VFNQRAKEEYKSYIRLQTIDLPSEQTSVL